MAYRVRSWHKSENREIDEWVDTIDEGLAVIQAGNEHRVIPGEWGEGFSGLPNPLYQAMPVYFEDVPRHLHAEIYRVKRQREVT